MSRRWLRAATCALALSAVATQAQTTAQTTVQKAHKGPGAHDRRAAAKAYTAGARAVEAHDMRAAYDSFSEAAALDPSNDDYRNAVEVAKSHFVTDLVQQAEKARIVGKIDVSRARLAEALELDPKNPVVAQHIDDLADLSIGPLVPDDISSQIGESIHLAPKDGRHSFHIRADAQSLLRQVLSAYGITPSFDTSVTTQSLRFDIDDIDFKQAAMMLQLATNTFFVPLDPGRVLIAKDTKENRTTYERLMLETVYLPGLNAQEATDVGNVARNILDIPQASVEAAKGTLTVRGPEAKLALLNHTLTDLLNGHSQVLLQVKIYEIARMRTVNAGVQLPQQFSAFNLTSELQSVINGNQDLINQIVSSGLASAGDLTAIAAILLASGQVSNSILSSPFAVFGGGLTETGVTLGSPTLNLALNTSDSRAIDDIQLRVQDQETGSVNAGVHYPIIQSTYSNLTGTGASIPGLNTAGISSQLAALGLNTSNLNQTIPQVQYQDLGLIMKATPHIHNDQSVGLKLNIQVQALGGTSINSIPILTNRQFTTDLDLRDGESTMVSSNLTSQEANAISGLPGLSEIPGLRSTTDKNVQNSTDELVILITPHVVRLPHRTGTSQVMMMPTHQ